MSAPTTKPDTKTAHTPMKVWWIPQVPMKAFEVEVSSIEEGVKLLDVLAKYDAFQFENNVKPDYCNAGGLMVRESDGEWCDWYDEETGEDDPAEFLAAKAEGRTAPVVHDDISLDDERMIAEFLAGGRQS